MNNQPRPHVLHIASGDLWAGAESQLFTLVRTLHSKLGISVRVILLNHGTLEKKLHEAGINVLVLDESCHSSLVILRNLIRSIRRQQPDVIHTHRLKENILGSIAGYLAGGIPSMRTAHGAPEHQPTWRQPSKRIFRTLDRITGRYLQRRIIAVSEDLAEILHNDFRSDKIHVINNGIDIDSTLRHAPKRNPSTHSRPEIFRIGIAGRLVPVKRVDLFIRTARYIMDNYPDMRAEFYIFGDGPLQVQLEELSRELKTDSIIHFKGHCDDIPERLLTIDMIVMTSDHEGLPMILLEAMALNVPVIAHATGGIPALLDNGLCGTLVKDHTPEGYARAVHSLSVSVAYRNELTVLAQAHIRSHYSAETNARSYISQYNEIRS